MALHRIICASRPFGFDKAILASILTTARSRNARDNITGAMICRGDLHLQLLEGPKAKVEAASERIAKDELHLEVRRLVEGPTETRLFGQWAMRNDPAQCWMWTREDVHAGALDAAPPEAVRAVFERLAEEL